MHPLLIHNISACQLVLLSKIPKSVSFIFQVEAMHTCRLQYAYMYSPQPQVEGNEKSPLVDSPDQQPAADEANC